MPIMCATCPRTFGLAYGCISSATILSATCTSSRVSWTPCFKHSLLPIVHLFDHVYPFTTSIVVAFVFPTQFVLKSSFVNTDDTLSNHPYQCLHPFKICGNFVVFNIRSETSKLTLLCDALFTERAVKFQFVHFMFQCKKDPWHVNNKLPTFGSGMNLHLVLINPDPERFGYISKKTCIVKYCKEQSSDNKTVTELRSSENESSYLDLLSCAK